MPSYTPRLGLIKPDGPEEVDVEQLNSNSDILDKWQGAILVNNGVIPPAGDLFDGAVVMEKTSGLVWVAVKNGGGTFDRKFIAAPDEYFGYSMNSQTTTGLSPLTGVENITAQPYKRLLKIHFKAMATTGTTSTLFGAALRINGDEVNHVRVRNQDVTMGATHTYALAADTTMTLQLVSEVFNGSVVYVSDGRFAYLRVETSLMK